MLTGKANRARGSPKMEDLNPQNYFGHELGLIYTLYFRSPLSFNFNCKNREIISIGQSENFEEK